jgi:hypothetical protein
MQLVSVTVQETVAVASDVLRLLIVAIAMHEPGLVRRIHEMVPGEPEEACIAYEAFYGCKFLTSVVVPGGITSIDFSAFRNCSLLTSVVVPPTVTTIESHAFFECVALVSIVIPDAVVSIGERCFFNCAALVSIELPAATTVGRFAFHGCSPGLVIIRR